MTLILEWFIELQKETSAQQAVWHERRCSPQKPLYNFAGFSPARAAVSRLPRQAATTLYASRDSV